MRLKTLLLINLFSSNIGEWVYFIALNLMVLKLTDSAFAVSILYILLPVAMLLTNSWAGSVIDRVNIRTLLISLNILRALLVVCIALTANLFLIYSLSLLLHIGTSFYSTASFVYITRIIPEPDQQRFNAWKSMAQSSGFILGPSIAGILFIIGSVETAIVINAIILLISSMIYLYLPNVMSLNKSKSISFEMLREDWRTVFHYTKNNRFIALIFILNGLYMVCLTSIDSLEAAFSMNTLQLDESTYGLLVSVAGIGFVIGSIVNIKWAILPLIAIKWGMVCTAIGYSIYSFSTSWGMAAERQRYRCKDCRKTFTDVTSTPLYRTQSDNASISKMIVESCLISTNTTYDSLRVALYAD